MDNITHSLTGLALARAGFNRLCPHATALLVLSANVPDIDIVVATRGALPYLEAHRGYSHSLLGLPLAAALVVLVVAGAYRQKLPWLRAWLLCCFGVASHLMIDSTNNYGVRLLLPFSSRWFHLDLNSLYDGWILLALVIAAIWPLFARLVSREIGDRSPPGRGIAMFALMFFVLFDCWRGVLHFRAVAQLESHLYNDLPPLQTAALPEPFSPFHWAGVVETVNDFRLARMDAFGQFDLEQAQVWYKPAPTPALERAKATEPFRFFLYFARFPVWSEQVVLLKQERGKRIELTDLRFGTPGAGSFHCIALENSNNQVLQSLFTYGSGANLGWGRAK